MSASTFTNRAKTPAGTEANTSSDTRPAWVGVDHSATRPRPRTRGLLPLLALALLVALGVAALRIDLIRTRYALATVMAEENALIEEQRELIVRKRQLRDPVELAVQARERGFRPPAQVFRLPDPLGAGAALPPVAAGPPTVGAR